MPHVEEEGLEDYFCEIKSIWGHQRSNNENLVDTSYKEGETLMNFIHGVWIIYCIHVEAEEPNVCHGSQNTVVMNLGQQRSKTEHFVHTMSEN